MLNNSTGENSAHKEKNETQKFVDTGENGSDEVFNRFFIVWRATQRQLSYRLYLCTFSKKETHDMSTSLFGGIRAPYFFTAPSLRRGYLVALLTP